MMPGEAQALYAWTEVSRVPPLVSGTMTWMMTMYVDDPSRVECGPDSVGACWENRSKCHGNQRLSVLDGLVGIRAFLVRDMAVHKSMVTAAGVCFGPGMEMGTCSGYARTVAR